MHPAFAGITMLRCDLDGAEDLAGALARITGLRQARIRDREWIDGSGWRMEWFPGGTPSRELLDSVVPDRPAYLTNRDGHGAWVNSRALELAGLTAATPDPADGRIERRAGRRAAGHPARGRGAAGGPARARPDLRRAGPRAAAGPAAPARAGHHRLAGRHRGGVPGLSGPAARSTWPPRGTARSPPGSRAPSGGTAAGAPSSSTTCSTGGEEGQAGRFRAGMVKIMQDGVAENFTAGMIDPYLDACGCQTGNRGLSYVDPADLAEQVTRLDAAGFGVHVHAIGDRAVREALDAFEAARAANVVSPGRHHIAHLQVLHPDDIPRFAELSVTANMQALWAAHEPQMDDLTIPFLGPGAGRPAVPVRRPAAGRGPAGGGQRLGGEQRQPAGGDPCRGEPGPACPSGAPGAEPLLPGQALTLAEAHGRVHRRARRT